jgi:hypothetical protein
MVGFEENRIDVVMYWRLIVVIAHNAIDIYKRHVFCIYIYIYIYIYILYINITLCLSTLLLEVILFRYWWEKIYFAYNIVWYNLIKIVIVGFEENRIDVVMYWRLIVVIAHNAIDIYKRHVFRTTCSTHKSNAWYILYINITLCLSTLLLEVILFRYWWEKIYFAYNIVWYNFHHFHVR